MRRGKSVIYITLTETRVELNSVAASHGWSMDGIHVEDIIPDENILHPEQQFTIFHPSEIEMGMTTQRILDTIEKYMPTRVVLDSLSELQLLAESPLRYRRQVLALKQYLAGKGCTTLFLDDRTALSGDLQVRSVAHGVITLELINQDYGSERRRVRIVKYRGIAFRGGSHDYKIITGGLQVFPRLIAAHTRVLEDRKQLSSGLPELDALTGGGLDEGTSTLISGPPGTGKSSLCSQYAYAATQRGQKAAMFLFEEAANNLLLRSCGLGMDLRGAVAGGMLDIQQIDPAEMAPGEFMQAVTDAEANGARVIVIDSLNGYLKAMPGERFLATHLHELLTYLGQRGVVTILVGVQAGVIGGNMSTTVDASYIADSVIMLRYFEARGAAAAGRSAEPVELTDLRPKVLVVDDNRDACDSLQTLFEMENCQVATAYDGCEAVLATEQAMPDMIVMDLGMPGMDGYEATRRIRNQPGAKEVLMIALTGWGQSDARQRTIEAGFDHHLIKPVNFDEIRQLATGRLFKGQPLSPAG